MGFWSTLGKIASVAVPIAAAIPTGGTSLLGMGLGLGGAAAGAAGGAAAGGGMLSSILGNVGKIGGAVAPVLGGLAKGRAEGQQQDYQNESARGGAMNTALLQEMQAQIAAANQNQGMQGRLAGDVARGDVMSNLQDVNIPDSERVRVMHFGGGLRPSNMGPNSRAAGGMLSQNALGMMGQPGIQAPSLSGNVADLPQDGFLDKLLGVAGPASALGGALFGGGGPMQPRGTGVAMSGTGVPQGSDPTTGLRRDAFTDRQAWEDLLADPMRGVEG